MPNKAFVLIETAVGTTNTVVNNLRLVEGVASVDAVVGPYDVIAVLEAQDVNTIGELVTNKIHAVGSVVKTVTCLAVSLP